jgi:hypothetical protein
VTATSRLLAFSNAHLDVSGEALDWKANHLATSCSAVQPVLA